MKRSIIIFTGLAGFLLLSLQVQPASGQSNPFSQENAEKQATQKYEAQNPVQRTLNKPSPGENEAFFGARLTRSATLLASSNKERRNTVRVLIYGQSIVGSVSFTENIAAQLKERFPFADVQLENRAIGGFGGEQLVRTSVHDFYPTYPDLVIFHVYGGEKTGELEQIFSNMRRYTTSDILLMSHHLTGTQTVPSEASAKYIRYIANKYDCELADISAEWPKYLAENNLKTPDLLRDGTHPNKDGNWVLAQLVCRHIRFNPLFSSDWYKSVRSYYTAPALDFGLPNEITLSGKGWKLNAGALVSESKENTLRFSFTGNRVDVITGHPLNITQTGNARLLLDGKPVDNSNTVFTITRPSPGTGTWWPAVRQIGHTKPLIAEDWVLKVTAISADSTIFTYKVTGSKTGEDGTGNNRETFISRSGRVVIQPADVLFENIRKTFKVSTPNGFEVKWSVVPLFKPAFKLPVATDKTLTYRTTILQGISNGPHTLEIIPAGDGPVAIEYLEVFEPGLK